MKWEEGEDSQNLEDRRSGSGVRPVHIGGAGVLIVLVIGYLMGASPQQLLQLLSDSSTRSSLQTQQGAPGVPDQRSHEFASKILRFTEKVWTQKFQEMGKTYTPPHMVLFTDQVQTGCGNAPGSVGPFYCPEDRTVYLDPTFFDELQQQLGGSKADFSNAYVIAHEVGHHVQNLLGYNAIVEQKRRTLDKAAYNQWSVRLELQADYLAGVWAHYGQEEFHFIEAGDVDTAIQSANAIGDDRLQRNSSGFTSPEKYTHGTSAQRVKWFSLGLKTGDMGKLKEMFQMPYEDL